jgi:hypothetical protein
MLKRIMIFLSPVPFCIAALFLSGYFQPPGIFAQLSSAMEHHSSRPLAAGLEALARIIFETDYERHQQDNRPLPAGPEAFTWVTFEAAHEQWLIHALLDSHRQHGESAGPWSDETREVLQAYAAYLARDYRHDDSHLQSLLERGAALMDAGCRDPGVVFLRGDLLRRLGNGREAKIFLISGLALMEEHGYPAMDRYLASRSLHAAYRMHPPAEDIWPELNGKILRSLAEAAAAENFSLGKQRYYFHAFWNFWIDNQRPEQLDALIAALDEIDGIDPWLRSMIDGVNHIRLAWQARGDGWAQTVSKENSQIFRRELSLAEERLTAAHELQPHFPEAAAQMIRVRMAVPGPGTEREWFDRAVAAQFDYLPAYNWLLKALLPRWGGSHRALYDFGLECLQTQRFETRVPSRFAYALHLISEDLEDQRWEIYRREGIYPLLQQYFLNTLNEPAMRYRHRSEKSHYALVAWAAGAFEDAALLLDELDSGLDREMVISLGIDLPTVLRDVQAYRSTYGQLTRQGLAAEEKGELEKALKIYQQALATPERDFDRDRFAWEKICRLHFTADENYSVRLARQLHAMGRREIILLKFRSHLEAGAVVSKTGVLYNSLVAMVGRHNLDYIELLVHESNLDHKRAEDLRQQIETLPVEVSPEYDAETIGVDRALALLRLLLEQDLSGHKPEELGGLFFSQLQHLSDRHLALDFVQAHLRDGRVESYKKYHLASNYFSAIAFERNYDLRLRQEVMTRLQETSDPKKFLRSVALMARLHGSPVLFLEMAALCRQRGEWLVAKQLENLAMDWHQSFYTAMDSTPWASYHTMAPLAMVEGYEAQALQYGQLCIDSRFCISGNLLIANALIRSGRPDEAAHLTAGTLQGQLRQTGHYCLPGKIMAEFPDLLMATIQALLESPKLSEAPRTLLTRTFHITLP